MKQDSPGFEILAARPAPPKAQITPEEAASKAKKRELRRQRWPIKPHAGFHDDALSEHIRQQLLYSVGYEGCESDEQEAVEGGVYAAFQHLMKGLARRYAQPERASNKRKRTDAADAPSSAPKKKKKQKRIDWKVILDVLSEGHEHDYGERHTALESTRESFQRTYGKKSPTS